MMDNELYQEALRAVEEAELAEQKIVGVVDQHGNFFWRDKDTRILRSRPLEELRKEGVLYAAMAVNLHHSKRKLFYRHCDALPWPAVVCQRGVDCFEY